MKGILNRIVFAALALLCAATAARADIKIKSKTSFGDGAGVEQTVYIKGKRQRTESMGGMATVTQCDLRRTVRLNDLSKTYLLDHFDGGAATAEAADGETRASTVRKGGVVTMTFTTTDTGERRQMFGNTARRIKTAVVTEPSPDACSQEKTRMETDGWYIDLNVGFDCHESASTSTAPRRPAGGCRDKFRTRQGGSAKLGYPVKVTTTIFGEDGKPSSSITQEVIELSQATLEQSLFEIPEGYREVRDAQQMYSPAALAAAMSSGDDDEDEDDEEHAKSGRRAAAKGSANVAARASAGVGSGGGVTNGVGTPSGAGTAGGAAPQQKRQGILRVGLAPAKTGAVGEGMDAAKLAEAVRNTLASYLTGPTIEVVRLEARLPQQAEAEARQKGCDLVLYATASHKKGGGGGFGGFLKKAAPIADSVIPYGNDAAEHVASQAASATIYTAADAASSVKSKDELTLEFSVQALAAGSAPLTKTVKARAKSDGDDLVSRLAEQVATEVLAAASKAGR